MHVIVEALTKVTEHGAVVFNGDGQTITKSHKYGLELRQSIFSWSNWVALKRADSQVAQAEADYQNARQELVTRVAQRYFDVLAAQDDLDAQQAAANAIQHQLEQSEQRFNVGLIAITDVQEARAAHDSSVAAVIAAKRALASAQEALREITGDFFTALARPVDSMELTSPNPASEEQWVQKALEQNLALISSRLGADIAREDISTARGGYAPSVDFIATGGKNVSDGDITYSLGGTGASAIDLNYRTIGVQVTIPLYSGGATNSRVREAVYRHRASRERLERIARQTERDTRDAYLGVLSEISRVKALKQALESNLTALKASEAGYEAGTRTAVDVLQSRRLLILAQTNYARSRYDYILNMLKLQSEAGLLTRQSLDGINALLKEGAPKVTDPSIVPGAAPGNPAPPATGPRDSTVSAIDNPRISISYTIFRMQNTTCACEHMGTRWGLAARMQGGAEQFRRHVDDRDHPFVGHARRTDDAEDADHALAVPVGRGDHAAVVEDLPAGLVADEDLHAIGPQAVVEQVQDVALFVEGLEQPLELVDAGELGEAHQVGLPGDHVFDRAGRRPGLLVQALRHRDGVEHLLVEPRVRFLQLAQHLLVHLGERAAAAVLVEEIGGAPQLLGAVVALELDDAVLHLAVVHHQHDQHPVLGQADELDLRQRRRLRQRQRDQARELREVGQELRGRGDQRLRLAGRKVELAAQRRELERFGGELRLEQLVDEEAVATVGRHSARRGVRRGDESERLEVRHHVADRGRAQRQPGLTRQCTRADRLALANVALYQHAQQVLGALRQGIFRVCFAAHGRCSG